MLKDIHRDELAVAVLEMDPFLPDAGKWSVGDHLFEDRQVALFRWGHVGLEVVVRSARASKPVWGWVFVDVVLANDVGIHGHGEHSSPLEALQTSLQDASLGAHHVDPNASDHRRVSFS